MNFISEYEDFWFQGPHSQRHKGRIWKVPNSKGSVIGVHGYSEYGHSYAHFARFLNERGFNAYFYDQLGHGESDGQRANIDSFDDYVQSLEIFLGQVKERGGADPYFLFGHSLGGLVCIRFLQSSHLSTAFSKVALSSPLLGLAQYSRCLLPVLGLISRSLPNLTMSNERDIGVSVLTHDIQMREMREADPRINKVVTTHWVREFIKARTLAFQNIENLKLPMGIFQAGDDRVVDASESERFYSLLKSHKQWKSYPGFFHEIINEVDRLSVMEDIFKWLSSPSET